MERAKDISPVSGSARRLQLFSLYEEGLPERLLALRMRFPLDLFSSAVSINLEGGERK